MVRLYENMDCEPQYTRLSDEFSKYRPNTYDQNVRGRYTVQHVKSFTVSPTCIPLHTEDALRLLEGVSSIDERPHDMLIESSVNGQELVIYDSLNGRQEIERFPIKHLRAPRYRMQRSENTCLNNLLFFTVEAFSLPNKGPEMHEMHVFQVLNCPAKELVEDLLEAGMKPNYTMFSVISPFGNNYTFEQPIAENNRSDSTLQQDENTTYWEISQDWLNAECVLLNNCFDDVEYGLQCIRQKVQTSNPFNLGRRGKGFQKGHGSLDSEVSKDAAFYKTVIDLFEKIKFSIILLSRLDEYVPEPRAPVLVRQLFNILNECVGYWKKPKSHKIGLPSTIADPAFPEHTIKFLRTCLSDEHRTLLNDLGDAWNAPRESLKLCPVYVPKFRNGFNVKTEQYDPSLFDHNSPGVDLNPSHHYMKMIKLNPFVRDIIQSNRRAAKVSKSFTTGNPEEVSLSQGEFVEVLEDMGNWRRVRNESGDEGLCPEDHLAVMN